MLKRETVGSGLLSQVNAQVRQSCVKSCSGRLNEHKPIGKPCPVPGPRDDFFSETNEEEGAAAVQ
jgi:hypothetical protein